MIKLQLAINAVKIHLKEEDLTKLKVGLNNKTMEHKFILLDQLHIPLLMLGEKSEEQVNDISRLVETTIQMHHNFDLKLSGIWALPNQHEARLLYVGVQNAKELRSLQSDLSKAFFNHSETEYYPNLPVVRLKNYRSVVDVISPYKNRDFGKLKVDTLALYQIVSGGAYMTYKLLKTYRLGELSF